MYFDSHCHLDRIDLAEYDNNINSLVNTIESSLVTRMLCISVNLETFDTMYRKIIAFPQIFCSVGVHPGYEEVQEPSVDTLVALSKKNKVVAIGETGLDYVNPVSDMQWQRDRFTIHIEAAKISGLPLIIHTREAREDTIKIMHSHRASDVGGVMHCFTEDWEMAKQAIDMDFYISISGIVTFNQASNVREMAKKIPLDRLLIETDSPWLSPAPFRGKQNHPGRVPLVAEKLAEIRQEDVETIARATYDNANRLFNLKAD
ncbi:MAG: TatD family hydrolase [Gammaproteobacteria bacterium]|nr:TatD family hydrolase [Gammaproteobacteria bacterium]